MSNLIGNIRNSPMISMLGRVAWFSRTTMAILVLGLLISACTITGVANDQTTSVAPETAPNAVPVSVAENQIDEANPESSGLAQINALDADAIVAAQEEVISGIYERLVPSVVRPTGL